MAREASERTKIPTKIPQPVHRGARPAGRPANDSRPARGQVLASGTGRAATRGGGDVIELEGGVTVYPAREEHGRWRAVGHENGERQQCEAASEDKLAAKLVKVTERLAADAPNMKLPRASHSLATGASTHRATSSLRHTSQLRPVLTIFSALLMSSVLATTCSPHTPSLAAPSRPPRWAVT
jgi:hypothetical protein